MSRAARALGSAWVVGCGLLFALLGLAWPEVAAELLIKEGRVEVASHALLAMGVVVWTVRARRSPRALCIAVAVALALVLGEEIDWGVDRNLHRGAAYVVFAIPWAILYGAAWTWGATATRRATYGPLPPRADVVGFAIVVLTAAASIVLDGTPYEPALDELSELMLYGLIVLGGLRPIARSDHDAS